jgi:hypothetical protein
LQTYKFKLITINNSKLKLKVKKKQLAIILLCSVLVTLNAKIRTVDDAKFIGTSFFSNSTHNVQKISAVDRSLNLVFQKSIHVQSGDSISGYYVFNRGAGNGFVIVSADDRAYPVLGYCDNGTFEQNSIPENLKYWLSTYDNELKSLFNSSLTSSVTSSQTIKPVQMKKVSDTNSFASSISPLLGGIKWDQSGPYNNLCPLIPNTTTKTVTGCVATGMAQVMKYYQWPVTGKGSNSYTTTTNKIPLNLDFSQTTFDWANMTDTYSASSTTSQNNAVATLMYNCGVAVNMDYDASSGASTYDMAAALRDNFAYDSNLQYFSRNYYTRDEWVNIIKTELNASRPVLYAGSSTDGGHLFVCDGYDTNGLFHFNWGWSGTSNGYFEISALDPDVQGIGGGTAGFNSYQGALTGLQKPTNTSIPSYLIYTDDTLKCNVNSLTNKTGAFTITATNVYNQGVNTFSGTIALALYNSTGFIQILQTKTSGSVPSQNGWSSLGISTSLPSGLDIGSYQIYFVYKGDSETNWQMLRGNVGTPNYISVNIKPTSVNFTTPTSAYPNLKLNTFTVGSALYQNENAQFTLSVTNNGNEYNSILDIYLQSATNDTIYQFVSVEQVDIAAGETRQLIFNGKVTLNPGSYYVVAMYDPYNNYNNLNYVNQLGDYLTLNVLPTPTSTPILSLTSAASFPNPANVNKNFASLSATVTNTGGFFGDKMIAFIFPATGGSSLTYIGYQDVSLDVNATKTITFSGAIDLDVNTYKIGIYYRNSAGSWIQLLPNNYSALSFTLTDNALSTFNPGFSAGMTLFPNPVIDVLKIKSDNLVKTVIVCDLLGKKLIQKPESEYEFEVDVKKIQAGTYIIQIETENGIKTGKFVKY